MVESYALLGAGKRETLSAEEIEQFNACITQYIDELPKPVKDNVYREVLVLAERVKAELGGKFSTHPSGSGEFGFTELVPADIGVAGGIWTFTPGGTAWQNWIGNADAAGEDEWNIFYGVEKQQIVDNIAQIHLTVKRTTEIVDLSALRNAEFGKAYFYPLVREEKETLTSKGFAIAAAACLYRLLGFTFKSGAGLATEQA